MAKRVPPKSVPAVSEPKKIQRRAKFGQCRAADVDPTPITIPQTTPAMPSMIVATGPPNELPSAPIRIRAGTIKSNMENRF